MSQEHGQSLFKAISKTKPTVSCVPTNVITGFLGVGKTSAILHLLRNKPEDETWAVLVNEFGEIGIDGSMLGNQYSAQNGVYIREVPGGCMCCTAGLPMQVALTQLLRRAKPDRLLIEPTGLGHPQEVLETLNNENFQNVLSIQTVVTMVDARQLLDRRYAEHATYQQQIAIGDVIVANKQDLYDKNEKAALESYINKHCSHEVPVVYTQQGVIEWSLLDSTVHNKLTQEPARKAMGVFTANGSYKLEGNEEPENTLPEQGYIKAINQGEGFVSIGWRFSSQFEFDRTNLFAFLSGIDAERLKATFITQEGCFAYNITKDAMSEVAAEPFEESRIEIIASELNEDWESSLFDCVCAGKGSS